MLVLNSDDKDYTQNKYIVVIGVFRSIDCHVYADNEQEVIDTIVDYYEERETDYVGFFLTPEEIEELEQESRLEDVVQGGNHGRYMSFDWSEVYIKQIS